MQKIILRLCVLLCSPWLSFYFVNILSILLEVFNISKSFVLHLYSVHSLQRHAHSSHSIYYVNTQRDLNFVKILLWLCYGKPAEYRYLVLTSTWLIFYYNVPERKTGYLLTLSFDIQTKPQVNTLFVGKISF